MQVPKDCLTEAEVCAKKELLSQGGLVEFFSELGDS